MSDATSRTSGKHSGRRKPNGSAPERQAAPWADSALIAELSQHALTQPNLSIVRQEACELVSRRLGTEFVKILELVLSGEGLLLTAGIGWRPGYVGQVVVPLVPESQAGYTMHIGEPTVVDDLGTETRFQGMPLLHEHGVVSGVSAILRSGERIFGIMAAHTAERRSFTPEDVALLQSVAGIVAAAIDRRETEQALRESDERLRLAMEAGGMGTWEWDLSNGKVIWSDTLERIHGLEPGEFAGTPVAFFEFVHPDDRALVEPTIARALDAGGHEIEYRVVLRDGKVRWLTTRGVLVRDERGQPTRMIGVCMDITERRVAQEAVLEESKTLEALNSIGRMLSAELDLETVVQAVTDVVTATTGAHYGAFYFNRLDGAGEYAPYTIAGAERFPVPHNSDLFAPIFQADGIIRLDDVTLDERFQPESADGPQVRSFLAVPVVSRSGGVLGGLVLGHPRAGVFGEREEKIAAGLAAQAAIAIDNAQLYEAERFARAEAEAVGNRQAFLAEASTILSASLDYDETLASLAQLCVPFLADWCAIDLIEDSAVRRVIVVHSDPAKLEFTHKLQQEYPPDPNSPEVMMLLREGRPIFLPEIPQDLVDRNTRDAEHKEVVRGLGLRSAIGVPLKAGGRTIGILSLVTAESGRTYTREDVALAEDLGHRAGLAVENAILFRAQQKIGEELRRANEAKDEFLGMVSHELRTPITTISGGARLLRTRADTLDEESRRGLLEDIEQESERLHRIVENLLVLARAELGEEVQMEPVLAQRLAEKTVIAFNKRRPGRAFVVDLDDEIDPVRGSSLYLEQILRNLVNNADKYSPPDTEIEVRVREVAGEAVISVMDRGPGIPADESELIFERFYRSHGTSKQAGGAGIGLTVCRRLVEAQNGHIWAEPREGGGLIVSFSLPLYEERA